MKKVSVFFAIFFVLTLSGCSISNSNQAKIENEGLKNQVRDLQQQIVTLKQETAKTSNVATSAPVVQTNDVAVDKADASTTSQKIVYKNEKYGFILNFPVDWSNFINQERLLDWGTNGKSNSIDFGFKEDNSLFNISIFTSSQWGKIQAEDGPKPTYLGKNSNYIFGISFSGAPTNDSMMQKEKEINNIFSDPSFFQIVK